MFPSLPEPLACTYVGTFFLLGTNVTIPGHLGHQVLSVFEGTPWVNLEIMKVMSTRIFVILIVYCDIGSQQGGIPTHVRAWRPYNEGGVGGAEPNQMKMWSNPGPTTYSHHKIQKYTHLLSFKFSAPPYGGRETNIVYEHISYPYNLKSWSLIGLLHIHLK